MIRKWLLLLLILGAAWWVWDEWQNTKIEQPPGILVPEPPRQQASKAPRTFRHKEYQLTPLAEFDAWARVLSTKRYYFDRETDLVPIDFALGWGPMSDSAVLRHFTINQSRRFYFWRTNFLPIPREQIVANSANMHLIPATEEIGRLMKKVKPGHVLHFSGYLVNAVGDDNWTWRSSTSRNDTGNGACELVYVTHFSAREKPVSRQDGGASR
jgi:hypothetical protein